MKERSAYIAGIIDGEGSIGFRAGKNRSLHLYVSNTHMPLLEWLKEQCGGSICCYIKVCQADCQQDHFHKRSKCWRWTALGERAAVVLRNVLPFMIIKKTKAIERLVQWDEYSKIVYSLGPRQSSRRKTTIRRVREDMSKRGWDCASGVIWNLKAIESVKEKK